MLVSCIMLWLPGRESLRSMAEDCFRRQTHRDRELVKVQGDTGEDLHTLRNRACEAARGEVILHWDDDDWSAPDRIERQLAHLSASGADVTGFMDMPFYNLPNGEAYMYETTDPTYCVGTSLCYKREAWQRKPFVRPHWKDGIVGEDNDFVAAHRGKVSSTANEGRMVATCHTANTCNKEPKFSLWRRAKDNEVPEGFHAAIKSWLL